MVARTDTPVLLLGETGTGKELLARAIHEYSDSNAAIMGKVNCAALPAELIESELFGHKKGAFTGATQQRKGRPTAAACFWTNSANCRYRRKPNCCGSRNSNGSAAAKPCASMCASSPRPIEIPALSARGMDGVQPERLRTLEATN